MDLYANTRITKLVDWYNFCFMRRGLHSGGSSGWHYDNKCSVEFCNWPDLKTRRAWLAEDGFVRQRRGILKQRVVMVLPPKPPGQVPSIIQIENRLRR